MGFSNTENFPYPRRNGINTDWPVLPIVTPKQKGHTQPISLLPKMFSMPQISTSNKHGSFVPEPCHAALMCDTEKSVGGEGGG